MSEKDPRIAKFEKEHPQIRVAYGGDGEIVSCWRQAHKEKKLILPIRNYGQCEKHKDFLDQLLNAGETTSQLKTDLKMTLHGLIECRQKDGVVNQALAEFTLVDSDITTALRFNIYVNGKMFFENVISTGILVSTPLGATGYWSSVARTLFRDGFGIAFIAPTIGINNLVLKPTDRIELEFVRQCDVKLAADKEVSDKHFNEGDRLEFTTAADNVALIGYSDFQCHDCRANRHGTKIVNQYVPF